MTYIPLSGGVPGVLDWRGGSLTLQGATSWVKKNLVRLQFSPIRNFLMQLGFLKNDKLIQTQFITSANFVEWFRNTVVPIIEQSQVSDKPLQELTKRQERQATVGVAAAKYILDYEKSQRASHPTCKRIKPIS